MQFDIHRLVAHALGVSLLSASVGCDTDERNRAELELEDDDDCDDGACDSDRDGNEFYVCTPEMFSTMLDCGPIVTSIVTLIVTNTATPDSIGRLAPGVYKCTETALKWAACHQTYYGHGVSCRESRFGDGVVGNAEISCSNGDRWNAATDNPLNCNDEDYGYFCNFHTDADDDAVDVADPTDAGGAGSCANACGLATDVCGCDAACSQYGDCCPDYQAQCGA